MNAIVLRAWSMCGICVALCLSLSGAKGEDRPGGKLSAKEAAALALVQEALHAEIDGRTQERAQLLRTARQYSSDLPLVHWASGDVRGSKGWLTSEEAGAALEKDRQRVEYRQRRAKAADTVDAHMHLATFCGLAKLNDEERAHLSRVLDLHPEHSEARQRLGFRKIGDRWFSAEEIALEQRRSETLAANLKAWRSTVEKIAKHGNSALARGEVAQIQDASAIPAMELLLSNVTYELAVASVEKIATFQELEATHSLARHAVLSPWREVRDLAAKKLQERPEEDYVPLLLGGMSLPIKSNSFVEETKQGRLLYRHEFVREALDTKHVLVFETTYRRTDFPAALDVGSPTLARAGISQTFDNRERRMTVQNQTIGEINQRVAAILTTIRGSQLSTNPEDWWKWWDERNELIPIKDKTTFTRHEAVERNIDLRRNAEPEFLPPENFDRLPSRERRVDCLIAGTLIQTSSGPKAIEQIRIGDLVLAQHPVTGELAFKAVLRSSIRPPESTVSIVTATETIQCSPGHAFWVAGSGWVRARSLASGAELHTLAGSMRVSEVKPAESVQTYNLNVADFHTYFVGPAKVLSHDNTDRLPARTVVPGLVK